MNGEKHTVTAGSSGISPEGVSVITEKCPVDGTPSGDGRVSISTCGVSGFDCVLGTADISSMGKESNNIILEEKERGGERGRERERERERGREIKYTESTSKEKQIQKY